MKKSVYVWWCNTFAAIPIPEKTPVPNSCIIIITCASIPLLPPFDLLCITSTMAIKMAYTHTKNPNCAI